MSVAVTSNRVALVEAHFARSTAAAGQFFTAHARAIADACCRMAERFERRGTLLVFGEGAQVSDAHHVSVEFVHPVIVGKRALPAIAVASSADCSTAASVAALGKRDDIALAICAGEPTEGMREALAAARQRGMLTLLLSAGTGADRADADIRFSVAGADPLVVQEVHETLYHVLWELVHVFLDAEDGRTLYPFLFQTAGTEATGHEQRLQQVQASTRRKCDDICDLRTAVRRDEASRIAAAGDAMAARVARGGKLVAFGNGGSATDAQDAVADCMQPAVAGWKRIPALALTDEVGVVTAVANDVGFDHVFSRQVIAFGRPEDIALGFTTSGTSRSVVNGLREARSRGLLTIALTGYDGGALAPPGAVDYCFNAACNYVPRIQEAHATIWHALLATAQSELP